MTVGIIGAGVAGLELARILKRHKIPVGVDLYNPSRYTTVQAFYPEYAARYAKRSEFEIDAKFFCDFNKIRFFQSLVSSVERRKFGINVIHFDHGRDLQQRGSEFYRYVVVASGLHQTLNDLDDDYEFEFGDFYSVKRLRDATRDLDNRSTVTIIGAGSTGIELACLFRDSFGCKIFLVEAENRILPSYHENVSKVVDAILDKKNVFVFRGEKVENVDKYVVHTQNHHIKSDMVVWTVGMRASRLARSLDFPKKDGFLLVDNQLRVGNDIFAIGDNAWIEENGKIATKNALEAERQARFVSNVIENEIRSGKSRKKYGILSSNQSQKALLTVGRRKAIAICGKHVLHHCQERVYKYKHAIDQKFVRRFVV